MDLSIIIVNWNSAGYVRRCIRSIRRHTRDLKYEIIVIDNASFDSCDAALKEDNDDARFIQSRENLGFARANNRAAEAAGGSTLLFLNPDTEVADASILRLYRALREIPDAGIAGARLLNGDGTLQTSCIQSFPTVINQVLDSDWLRKVAPGSRLWGTRPFQQAGVDPGAVEVISGACMMISRDLFERIGRFSEDYFMYTEDIDLCHKVMKAGHRNYYVPEAVVTHFGGGSSKQAASNFSNIMMRESIWRFLCKTRGRFYGGLFRGSMLLSALVRLAVISPGKLLGLLRRHPNHWDVSFERWRVILLWSLGRQDAELNSRQNESGRTREHSGAAGKSGAVLS